MSAGRCAKKFNVNIVIMYDHVSCKNVGGLHGLFEDQARERGIHLIWIPHDVMDPRTVSPPRDAGSLQPIHDHRLAGRAAGSNAVGLRRRTQLVKEDKNGLVLDCSDCGLQTLFGLLFLAYMTNADMKLIEKLYDALIKYHDSKTVEEKI